MNGHRRPLGGLFAFEAFWGAPCRRGLDSCQSTLGTGLGQTTVEFKVSLVRPITSATGVITAEGKVLNRGRCVGTAEGRVADRDGVGLAGVSCGS